ncbi:MAG TPA: DNA polymerase III subunit delta [Acidimicrobiales bacterium]
MSVYLLRGDDEVLLGDAVTELVARLVGDDDRSLVVEEFDGEEYPLGAVVDAARTPPFLTDRRVVVARGVGRFTDPAPLAAYLIDPLPTTDLVLTASGERLPKPLLDAVKKAGGEVVATGAGRNRQERSGWIDERLAASDVRLDPSARTAVVEWLGEDLGRLPALLETLAVFEGRLTKDEVEPFLGEAGSVPPWDLTDAIDKGDTAAALSMLNRMDRHPLAVMAILQGHYERMLRLDGADVRDRSTAAAHLKVSPFQAGKALEQGRRLGHDGVARAVELLAGADLDLRGQKSWPPELVMEVLVARLSRLAPRAAPARR